jgi:hypothetical protein
VCVAILLISVAALSAFYVESLHVSNSKQQTTSTQYETDAPSVISSTLQTQPGGYVASASGRLEAKSDGAASAAYGVMSQSASAANLTVIVFDQVSSAQSYFARFRSSVQGLPGYSDLSSTVSGFQQYGACYGYGEDVDGIAVAVGICTKGNVFLEVHITSSNAFSTVQSDLTTLMGAAYENVS